MRNLVEIISCSLIKKKKSKKTVIECITGLMSQVLKDQLVNKVKNTNPINNQN